MNRINSLICIRGKDYSALKNFNFRSIYNFQILEFSTAEFQDKENFNEKIEKDQPPNDISNRWNNSFKFHNLNSVNVAATTSNNVGGYWTGSMEVLLHKDPERLINLINQYSTKKSIQVLKYFATKNFRSARVLEALSQKICEELNDLEMLEYSDVFYSWAVLSFKNKTCLDIFSKKFLKQNMNSISKLPSVSILRSIGALRYRNCELIDMLLKYVIDSNSSSTTTPEYLTAFFTLAAVNYMSPYSKILLKALSSCTNGDFTDSKSYVNFVWATIILNELSEKQISEVLSDEFINHLSMYEASLKNNSAVYLKLLNINAAASLLLPSYSGPFLNRVLVKPIYSKSKLPFLSRAVDGLCQLFPKQNYFQTMKDTEAGFLLDIECYLDSKGLPSSSKKDSSQKVGIILLNYNDLCIDDKNTLSGVSSFQQNILKAKNYHVLLVPYNEYPNSLTLAEKKTYFQNKLKECIKN